LITSGLLKPGDIASERKLAERQRVGRTYVRDTIGRLDFILLKTILLRDF